MRVYIIDDTRRVRLAGSREEAVRLAREGFTLTDDQGMTYTTRFVLDDVQISEADLTADKAALLDLINDGLPAANKLDAYTRFTILRRWELTPRGGLKLTADYREGA